MSLIQLSGGYAAAIILCLFAINVNIDICSSQHVAETANDYNNIRSYMPDSAQIDFVYHNHDEMTRFLRYYDQNLFIVRLFSIVFLASQLFRWWHRATSARFPNLTALYSVGKSVQGRDLWVMVVSASPYEHMLGKPDVKYIGNIHGNEPVGRELLLHMIQYMVTSYATDPYIRWLLDNTRIHFMPSMNPDGYAISKEGTCDGAGGRWDCFHETILYAWI